MSMGEFELVRARAQPRSNSGRTAGWMESPPRRVPRRRCPPQVHSREAFARHATATTTTTARRRGVRRGVAPRRPPPFPGWFGCSVHPCGCARCTRRRWRYCRRYYTRGVTGSIVARTIAKFWSIKSILKSSDIFAYSSPRVFLLAG